MSIEPIFIDSEFHSPQDLIAMLPRAMELKEEHIEFELQEQESAFRADPVVLAAVATGTATIVASIITGIFAIMASSKAPATTVVKTTNGREVTVPFGTPHEEIEKLLNLAAGERPSRILVFEVLESRSSY